MSVTCALMKRLYAGIVQSDCVVEGLYEKPRRKFLFRISRLN